jgi:hypothetical protein
MQTSRRGSKLPAKEYAIIHQMAATIVYTIAFDGNNLFHEMGYATNFESSEKCLYCLNSLQNTIIIHI